MSCHARLRMRASHPLQVIMKLLYAWKIGYTSIGAHSITALNRVMAERELKARGLSWRDTK